MYSVAGGCGGREGRQGRMEGSGETVKFVILLSSGFSTSGREDAACCVRVQKQTPILLAYTRCLWWSQASGDNHKRSVFYAVVDPWWRRSQHEYSERRSIDSESWQLCSWLDREVYVGEVSHIHHACLCGGFSAFVGDDEIHPCPHTT